MNRADYVLLKNKQKRNKIKQKQIRFQEKKVKVTTNA